MAGKLRDPKAVARDVAKFKRIFGALHEFAKAFEQYARGTGSGAMLVDVHDTDCPEVAVAFEKLEISGWRPHIEFEVQS